MLCTMHLLDGGSEVKVKDSPRANAVVDYLIPALHPPSSPSSPTFSTFSAAACCHRYFSPPPSSSWVVSFL